MLASRSPEPFGLLLKSDRQNADGTVVSDRAVNSAYAVSRRKDQADFGATDWFATT